MNKNRSIDSLTHLSEKGNARMVDVTTKPINARQAHARASVTMNSEAMAALIDGDSKKGDVLAVARVAGIQAAKKCSELIPLCHSLMLSSVKIDFTIDQKNSRVDIFSICKLSGQTGVEMEALTAVSIAALTIYDMCKAVDKSMAISEIVLLKKSGGKSGDWSRQ